MSVFNYAEWELYSTGLQFGAANLARNRFALGLRKTVGKLTQPINSYTRFPEYFFIKREIERRVAGGQRLQVLDVGSPKLLGLMLAAKWNVEVQLTDITPLNLDEYKVMWAAIRERAKGDAEFSKQDARRMEFGNDTFDIAYSMSVLEHIEGTDGDVQGMRELIRVTKPGGLIIVSVPLGNTYVEQRRHGLRTASVRTNGGELHFFQRIYSPAESTNRLLGCSRELMDVECYSIWRANTELARRYNGLSENVRGMLGFLNPVISRIVNRDAKGVLAPPECSYGAIFTEKDVYGDLVIVARKGQNGAAD